MKAKLVWFALFVSLTTFSLHAQTSTQHIRMNQLGFLPFAQKQAAIVNANAVSFSIKNSENTVVFTNTLTPTGYWAAAGDNVSIADFTIVTTPGTYTLEVPGYGSSQPFVIADTVYSAVNNAIIKAFYFNRASTALLEEHAGIYKRKAGHPDTSVIILPSAAGPTRVAGEKISTPKGWYDAGDYNKYIVNSGITVGTLLQAYENYKEHWDTTTWNIPESGNSIPDLLDEIKWNLDWMLTMQDPDDGGVYNKTTEASFSASLMPDKVTSARYIVAKGTAATLDFAAVMAMAYRIYKPFYPSFADSCLNAAEYAWQWAVANPNIAFTNPAASGIYPAVSTGGYGDNTFTDERTWAASELFISTDKEMYAEKISLTETFNVPMWRNVAMLSLYSLYTHRSNVGDRIDTARVKEILTGKARSLQLLQASGTPYRVPVSDFAWGSNGIVSNQIVLLLFGYAITHEVSFLHAATASFDYILGRNATEYSFVTGYGHKASRNVHHRPSEADGIAGSIPGFLAGGPNGGNKADCGGTYSTFPAKAYRDEICSYTTNEIAINWQAPLTFAAHGIVSAYQTWISNLPAEFAYPSTNSIAVARTQESATVSLFANTEFTIETNDNWYTITPASHTQSGVATIDITEFNEGDSIRHGKLYIMIDSQPFDSIEITQTGRLKNFRIEAEEFTTMVGVQTEATSDIGGGLNVGWIDNNDTIRYILDITTAGSYSIVYRYASLNANSEFFMVYNDSVYSLAQTKPTGGWQVWKNYTDTAYFEEGIYEITLVSQYGGFNLNYIDVSYITEENIAAVNIPTTPPLPPDPPISIAQIHNSRIFVQNPITNNNIRIHGLQPNESIEYTIYNSSGKHIVSGASIHNTIVANLSAGVYICKIHTKSQTNYCVIVKQ